MLTTDPQGEDTPETTERNTVLLSSTATHGPTCSLERVPCPIHGAPLGKHYMPAEIHRRASGTFLFAHDCHSAWRLIEAAA